MKLNNRGWGIGVMVGFICVFVIAIIIIAVLAYYMGVGNELPISVK